jgi:hypothetical protein
MAGTGHEDDDEALTPIYWKELDSKGKQDDSRGTTMVCTGSLALRRIAESHRIASLGQQSSQRPVL